jgi:hypothetical protein
MTDFILAHLIWVLTVAWVAAMLTVVFADAAYEWCRRRWFAWRWERRLR